MQLHGLGSKNDAHERGGEGGELDHEHEGLSRVRSIHNRFLVTKHFSARIFDFWLRSADGKEKLFSIHSVNLRQRIRASSKKRAANALSHGFFNSKASEKYSSICKERKGRGERGNWRFWNGIVQYESLSSVICRQIGVH